MIDRLESCNGYRATIPLSFLQISDLCTVPTRFYESLNEKNCMWLFGVIHKLLRMLEHASNDNNMYTGELLYILLYRTYFYIYYLRL